MTTRGENEWQLDKTPAECLLYMLDNEISTDICLVVGPPDGNIVTFHAHKCILISRSPVFEGMFSSGMSECRSDVEATVRIEDIDADIFKEVLNYMYCECASISSDSAEYLIYAGKKYMLPKLVGECYKCISANLNVNNVIDFLDHSLLLDEQQLQSACLKLISLNAKAVLTGTEILSASRLGMEAIIDANTIAVSESLIYENAIRWAKHQLQTATTPVENPTDTQIREALGDLLYKIRFPVMTPTEFAEISPENNVLTAEEKASIYYFFVTKKTGCQLKFPTVQRIHEEVWIDRMDSIKSIKWNGAQYVNAVNFTTDHDILLTGIGLYTGYDGKGYNVDVDILQSTNSMFKKSVTVPYTGNSIPFKISLDKPIVIPAGVTYSVKTVPHGPIGRFGNSAKVVIDKDTVKFTFSKHSESQYTDETYGQIPRLYFRYL